MDYLQRNGPFFLLLKLIGIYSNLSQIVHLRMKGKHGQAQT